MEEAITSTRGSEYVEPYSFFQGQKKIVDMSYMATNTYSQYEELRVDFPDGRKWIIVNQDGKLELLTEEFGVAVPSVFRGRMGSLSPEVLDKIERTVSGNVRYMLRGILSPQEVKTAPAEAAASA